MPEIDREMTMKIYMKYMEVVWDRTGDLWDSSQADYSLGHVSTIIYILVLFILNLGIGYNHVLL